MVEAVAAAPSRPFPTDLLGGLRTQKPKRVAVAVCLKTADQRELGAIPALSSLRAQMSVTISREGPDGPVRVLLARSVQVPAENPRVAEWLIGEVPIDGLVRAYLGEVGLGWRGRAWD
jgi:hypothetical protein